MAYKVFISYRRQGAFELAHLLYFKLQNDNYEPFFDVETMRSGQFNTQLYERIDECSDVIVLLSENALEPREGEDWMRMEVAYALKQGKNVRPVFMRNFKFPEKLPRDISKLKKCHGLTADMEYFDAVYEKLKKLIDMPPESPEYSATGRILDESPSLEAGADVDKNPSPAPVCAITGTFLGILLFFIAGCIPDAPAIIAGIYEHSLLLTALTGAVGGAVVDLLCSVSCRHINSTAASTIGILVTTVLLIMSGFIPTIALQIILCVCCVALLIKAIV